jgi:uncharacterized cysteine cluster protein YcgN (CxxCxxCC family)
MFQASMDLPPDKAKLLKQYDDEKKWDIICDQVSQFCMSFLMDGDWLRSITCTLLVPSLQGESVREEVTMPH